MPAPRIAGDHEPLSRLVDDANGRQARRDSGCFVGAGVVDDQEFVRLA
jgi:hypothetical protein